MHMQINQSRHDDGTCCINHLFVIARRQLLTNRRDNVIGNLDVSHVFSIADNMGVFDEHGLLLSKMTGINDGLKHGHPHEDAVLHLSENA